MISLKDARNTNNKNTINKLLSYKRNSYKIALAQNPNIDKNTMLKLLEFNEAIINKALASNINLDKDVAKALYRTEDFYVLEALAQNPSCPTQILDQLKSYEVLFLALAENTSTPMSTLEYIMSAKQDNEFCYDILVNILRARPDVKHITITRKIEAN